ncbi:MAG: hypothetical protein ISS70_23565 [Phycisphaerae bacterium]|nr:hypothetical protein [Phycisphaerae bacterium]
MARKQSTSREGSSMMTLDQPNSGDIRAHLFELQDTGLSLRIKAELPIEETGNTEHRFRRQPGQQEMS